MASTHLLLSILTLVTLFTAISASPMMIMTVHPKNSSSLVSFDNGLPIYTNATVEVLDSSEPIYQDDDISSLPSTPDLDIPSSNDTTPLTVPVGTVITACTVPGTIALTFDDGPSHHTPKLLDLLSEYGVRATFFVNGYHLKHNGHTEYLKRASEEGHQIASHTYSPAQLPPLFTSS